MTTLTTENTLENNTLKHALIKEYFIELTDYINGQMIWLWSGCRRLAMNNGIKAH